MKKNIGTADRIARLIIAAALAGAFFTGYVSGMTGVIALAVAAVMLLTALVSVCPLYAILGALVSGDSADADPHKSGVCCGSCGGEGHDDEAAATADSPPKLT